MTDFIQFYVFIIGCWLIQWSLPSSSSSTITNREFIRNVLKRANELDVDESFNRTQERYQYLTATGLDIVARIHVQNFLKVPMTDGIGHCMKSYGRLEEKRGARIPDIVHYGTLAGFITYQKGNSRGTSGVVRWTIADNQTVHLMWSIPYSFTLYNSYVAVGITQNEVLSSVEAYEILYNQDQETWFDRSEILASQVKNDLVLVADLSSKRSYSPTITFSILSMDEDKLFFKGKTSMIRLKTAQRASFTFWMFLTCLIIVAVLVLLFKIFICHMFMAKISGRQGSKDGERGGDNNNKADDASASPEQDCQMRLLDETMKEGDAESETKAHVNGRTEGTETDHATQESDTKNDTKRCEKEEKKGS